MQRENTVRSGTIGIWLTGLFVVALVAGFAGPAKAGLRLLSYTGTISFKVGSLPGALGAGGGVLPAVTYGGHLSTLAFPGGAFGPITVSVPVTSNATVNSVVFTGVGNLSATIAAISGAPPLISGAMGISGVAKICLIFAPCQYANTTVPLTPSGSNGFGIGGTQSFTGPVPVTMQNAPWTIGTPPTMTQHSPATTTWSMYLPTGFAHGPNSQTSSTARPSAVVQLVTASKVFTSLTASFPELVVTGVLNLHVVPEPGTLLLLGSGVAGLAMVGRRRRRG